MILGDFHIHSNFSDGRFSIPEIVDLFGGRGFGAIAITDHLCEERLYGEKRHDIWEKLSLAQTFLFIKRF